MVAEKRDAAPNKTKQHHRVNHVTANFFYDYYLPLKDIEIYTNKIQGDGV